MEGKVIEEKGRERERRRKEPNFNLTDKGSKKSKQREEKR